MPRKEFEPWFAVKVGIRQNHKIVDLSCDTARWGWIAGVMAEAKVQRPGGRFRSRAVLEEAIGRFAPYVDEYVAAGLLEVAPKICGECRKDVGDIVAGACVVHDWRHHQRDPDAAVRVAEWRAERGSGSSTPDESPDVRATYDGSTTDESSSERPANGDSRGRARARETGTVDRRQKRRTSPHVVVESSRDSPASPERADVQALLEWGFRRVTPKQRTVLDEIADRHRRKGDDGSWFAVEKVANAGELDPFRAVVLADKAEQDVNRRRIAEEESIWAQTKARDRREAEAIVGGRS